MIGELDMKCIAADLVPADFRRELFQTLLDYSVTLIGLRGQGYGPCGSGTLVRAGGKPFVLTAAHCARALANFEKIGVGFANHPHTFVIPKEPGGILVGQGGSEGWGPDLAFLPIPPYKVGTLSSVKSFYNLDLHRRQETVVGGKHITERGFWAIVGAPSSTSNFKDPNRLEFSLTVHWVTVKDPYEKDGFDYVDIDVPNMNFQGVSGGGLWQIDIGKHTNGQWSRVGAPALEGCAFYQTESQGDRRFIRCHARKTIYEHGLAALGSLT